MTSEQFRAAGHRMIDWLASYLEGVESRAVSSGVEPGAVLAALPPAAPERGEPWDACWRDIEQTIVPALVHWQHPMFFGYFPCNTSYESILGELLSAGLGVNGFLWQTGPAITELEVRVTDWLAQALALPGGFTFAGSGGVGGAGGGVIQGTASEAAVCAMLAARARALRGGANPASLVAYASSQAHSSIVKAAMVCGLGGEGPRARERVRQIDVDPALAMRPAALRAAIERDQRAGLTPCFVCATVGTTSTGAIDPIGDVASVIAGASSSGAPPAWLHVDAAYAGAACICPEFRPILAGVEHADSLSVNPHKWLLTNFDCSTFWTRDRASLLDALSITPAYLKNAASESGRVIDYRDWHVPLGRRFRALKLWLVLRSQGIEGLRAYIREHVRLAGLFESMVRGDPRFELPTPRSLGLVCFRLREGDGPTRALVDALNASGRILLTRTSVPTGPGGAMQDVARLALGATSVEERHVREAWRLIEAEATRRVGAGA